MNRQIYIDLGCNNGRTVKEFMEGHINYEAYGFDPIASYFDNELSNLANKYNFSYESKAAWIDNSKREFRIGGKYRAGSSIVPFKRIKRIAKTETVICFDFSSWILKNFEKSDYIFLRMDIEASEYYVLDKMIKDGSIYYINVLVVEFHAGRKINEEENKNKIKKMHDKIIYQLNQIENLELYLHKIHSNPWLKKI